MYNKTRTKISWGKKLQTSLFNLLIIMKKASPKQKRSNNSVACVNVCERSRGEETINKMQTAHTGACLLMQCMRIIFVCLCVAHAVACSGVTIHSFIFVGALLEKKPGLCVFASVWAWILLWSRANQSGSERTSGERRKKKMLFLFIYFCSGKDNWKDLEKTELKV